MNVRVDVYAVNQEDGSLSLDVANILLEELFDDLGDVPEVVAGIEKNGFAFYGGGAAPLFKIVKVQHE